MIKVLLYDQNRVREGKIEEIESHATAWVDVENPTDQELATINTICHIESTELQDNLLQSQGAVTKNFEEYSLLVFRSALRGDSQAFTQPFVILVSKKRKDFITLHRYRSSSLERIRGYASQRLAHLFNKGPTMLLYALLEEFIASYSSALETVSDVVEEVEDGILSAPAKSETMKSILSVKKALVHYRKDLAANREVISSIEKDYADHLDKTLLPKFRILYADTASLYDSVIIYHEILTTSTEVYLSIVSNNLNQTMKKMTSWGAIILVPSLIAGIYGMNFNYIPLAGTKSGFWLLIALMLGSVLGLVNYFKRKDWI